MTIIPSVFVFIFLFFLTTAIISWLQVLMDKITAWVILSNNCLANRLLMRDSLVLSLLSFYLLVSFISELYYLNCLSSSFSCSLARFTKQLPASLGESSEPLLLSLVPPSQSTVFQIDGGVYLGKPLSISVKIFSFALSLGLAGSLIRCFLMIKVSGDLFF